MNEKIQNILTEIESVIVGKNENVEKILMAILAQGHVLMEDVPGVGKTTTALTFAKVLGLDTRRVQFTSDTVPSDVIGYSVYDKSVDSFVYKPGAIMTNLLLADEINRTSSKTQSALLEAMEEHRVTVDGQTYDLPTPFVVLATQNPTGSAGTTLLPSSQLDRFLIRLSMGYPDHKSQINILRDRHSENPLDRVQPIVTKDELLELVRETRNVEANDRIFDYDPRRSDPHASHGRAWRQPARRARALPDGQGARLPRRARLRRAGGRCGRLPGRLRAPSHIVGQSPHDGGKG